MNRLKFHSFLVLFIALTLGTPYGATAASTKNGDVVIYNSGQALVSEVRTVTLPRGPANVVIRDVPATINAPSIRATAEAMTVNGVQYNFTPATQDNLLRESIGKELVVLVPSLGGEGFVKREGVLIAYADKPVFRFGKEIYAGDFAGIYFPELPEAIDESPSLILSTHNETPGKRDILLSYLMSGLSWRADYALTVDTAGTSGALTGWATVSNNGDHAFSSADVTLVAGTVQRARPVHTKAMGRTMVMDSEMAMAASSNVQQGSVSQYHTYSLDERVDLPGDTTRQIRLFDAANVGVREELTSRFHVNGNVSYSHHPQSVESRLIMKNTKDNGLGIPLPGGVVRVYMDSSSGQQTLVGEPSIGHSGNGATLELTLGQSFDVSVERTRTSYSKLGKRSYEVTWTLAVTNGRKTAQQLRLADLYSGDWKVTKASHSYTTPDSETLLFDLTVPPNADSAPMKITYTAQVSY